jgi:hypothetical protein
MQGPGAVATGAARHKLVALRATESRRRACDPAPRQQWQRLGLPANAVEDVAPAGVENRSGGPSDSSGPGDSASAPDGYILPGCAISPGYAQLHRFKGGVTDALSKAAWRIKISPFSKAADPS